MSFLPPTFTPPATLTHPDFIARKLAARDVDLDYAAVMSSLEIIRKTRGGSWPTAGLYPVLHQALKDWLAAEWPFTQPFWSNAELPKERYTN